MLCSSFEHVYIITAWWLEDFSEMNDNGMFHLKFYCRLENFFI